MGLRVAIYLGAFVSVFCGSVDAMEKGYKTVGGAALILVFAMLVFSCLIFAVIR